MPGWRRLVLVLCMSLSARLAQGVVDVRAVGGNLYVAASPSTVTLGDLLGAFQRIGVAVEVDPGLLGLPGHVDQRLHGRAADVLDHLLGDLNYLLTWRQLPSSAGPLLSLKTIRVYREDDPDAARPLAPRTGPVRLLGPPGRQYVAEDLLLGLRPGATPEQLRNLLVDIGGTLVSYDPATGALLVRLPEGADAARLLAALRTNPALAAAGLNWVYHRNRDPVAKVSRLLTSSSSSASAALPPLEHPQAVAVFDEPLGPDAAARLGDRLLVNATTVPAGFPVATPTAETHGSYMALLASGDASVDSPANLGANLPIVSVGIFDTEGRTTTYAVMQALALAAANGASVANLSWGTEVSSDFLDAAFAAATRSGIALVAAAGNDGKNLDAYYPAAAPDAFAVGAMDAAHRRETYSNDGPYVDATAVGDAVVGHYLVQGTSVSAALVSQQLADYRSRHPELSPAEAIRAFSAQLADSPTSPIRLHPAPAATPAADATAPAASAPAHDPASAN